MRAMVAKRGESGKLRLPDLPHPLEHPRRLALKGPARRAHFLEPRPRPIGLPEPQVAVGQDPQPHGPRGAVGGGRGDLEGCDRALGRPLERKRQPEQPGRLGTLGRTVAELEETLSHREFVEWLARENKNFLFLTNSSERSPRELRQKLQRMGMDPSLGIDVHFVSAAGAAGKRVIELETADYQLKLLSGFGPETQEQWLLSTVEEAGTMEADAAKLKEAWQKPLRF